MLDPKSYSASGKKPFADLAKFDFPLWRCPVLFCGFKTRYARTIRRHLELAHDFPPSVVRAELSRFWSCSRLKQALPQERR